MYRQGNGFWQTADNRQCLRPCNPDEEIELKIFHSEIQNDYAAIKEEEDNYQPIPPIANVSALDVEENYKMIKAEVADLIEREIGNLRAIKEAQEAPKREAIAEPGEPEVLAPVAAPNEVTK